MECYRYLHEIIIHLVESNRNYEIIANTMEIFDENDTVIKARPSTNPKSFTFYKNDIIISNQVTTIVPYVVTGIKQISKWRGHLVRLYVMSNTKNSIQYTDQINGMVKQILYTMRSSLGNS